MKIIYPGSFDPISNGHLDIIARLAKNYDEVIILVSNNINKKYTFSLEERLKMINLVTKDFNNVKIDSWDGLVVDYCKKYNINLIARGLRNIQDYENEFNLFQYNKDLNPDVETILLFPTNKNQFISSSAIKELVIFDVDISKYVPKEIVKLIENKYKNN